MKAYIFPGQGSQYSGMGKEIYESSDLAKFFFHKANEILGFEITKLMFEGTDEDLRQTKVTQPALFLHSVILAKTLKKKFFPDMTAGHSLGEFSALVASGCLSFESGLELVSQRAQAMQAACEKAESTMAAIIGLDDDTVEKICYESDEVVVPANYNCPGQLVISGSNTGIQQACEAMKKAGARMAIPLKVGGAFHSPFMEPARLQLEKAIRQSVFEKPCCPVYQNVDAKPTTDPKTIQKNLIAQLTAPVLWTQIMKNMIAGGAKSFVELGSGKALQGMLKRLDKGIEVTSLSKPK